MVTRNKFGQRVAGIACGRCGRMREVILLRGQPRSKLCMRCHLDDITGKNSPKFNNGVAMLDGYVLIRKPEHPKANYNGYVLRARLILEGKLGRYLLDGHEPHHLNGIKDDDRPENLIEVTHSAHSTITNYNRYKRYLRG